MNRLQQLEARVDALEKAYRIHMRAYVPKPWRPVGNVAMLTRYGLLIAITVYTAVLAALAQDYGFLAIAMLTASVMMGIAEEV